MEKQHGDVGVVAHDGEVQRGVTAHGRIIGHVHLGPGIQQVPHAVQVTSRAGNVKRSLTILKTNKFSQALLSIKLTNI